VWKTRVGKYSCLQKVYREIDGGPRPGAACCALVCKSSEVGQNQPRSRQSVYLLDLYSINPGHGTCMYVCTVMQVGLQLLQASHSRLVTPALIRVVIGRLSLLGCKTSTSRHPYSSRWQPSITPECLACFKFVCLDTSCLSATGNNYLGRYISS